MLGIRLLPQHQLQCRPYQVQDWGSRQSLLRQAVLLLEHHLQRTPERGASGDLFELLFMSWREGMIYIIY